MALSLYPLAVAVGEAILNHSGQAPNFISVLRRRNRYHLNSRSRSLCACRLGAARAVQEEEVAMTTTALLLAWVLAGSPQPVKEYHINQHQIRIPISIESAAQRAEIHELILFMSNDEGKTWNQQAVASPDQDAFPFYAPRDGVYWFTVCVVNQKGEREPEDIYKAPPSQITKIVVDSLKPLVRIKSAARQGDDLVVNWEIQEDHPDLATLKLEYKPANAPDSQWTPASIQPQLIGQGRFRVANPGPLDLRMQMQDLAGNPGVGSFKVAAALGTSGTQLASAEVPAGLAPTPPAPAPPTGSSWDKLVQPASTSRPEPRLPTEPVLPMPPAPVLTHTEPRPPVDRATPPPVNPFQIPGAPLGDGKPPLVASSDKTPVTPAPAATRNPASGTVGTLPPLQVINTRQVSIDYEVTKHGPSGIGKVELWMTRDDGRRWEKFAESTDLKPPLRVELPAEGAYGFRLLLHSKAGRHKPVPVSGDLPEMRVELDTTPPMAQLYRPEPDPNQADALILSWTASDRNLDAKPITLQWAEKAGGPWQTIVADWPNDGRYTWKLPPNIPFMVYLRLSAKDTAGNISTAETPEPICIDLKEPEGHLLGISGKVVRRP
jgi:hypothetical protein